MKDKRIVMTAMLLLYWSFTLTAQDVRVSLSNREGYVGLPLQYAITITGTKVADIPSLSGFDDFDIVYQGKNQSSQTSILNGSRTQTVKVQFTWQLIPLREGELSIPSQSLEIEGKTFETPGGTVTIRPPGKVDGFLLKMESEQKSAYRGQSLTVNLNFYVSKEVGSLNFTLPGQNQGSLEGEDFLILESRIPDRADSDIRQIPLGDRTFYGYVSSKIEGGKQYTILTVPLEIMPLKEGNLSLEGGTVSFSVEEGVWPRSTTVNHVIAADPFTLVARELPGEIQNSPNGIILAHDELKVSSHISANEARPGDPLTLTISLEGVVNPEYCEIPPLESFSHLGDSFSLPSTQSRPKIEEGVLTLVQTIRPISVQSTTVPSIEFVYLNLETNKVSRVSTEALPILMSSAGNLSVNDLEVFGNDSETQGALLSNDKGIRQNKSTGEILAAGDQRISRFTQSTFFLWLIFFPPLAFLIFLAGLFIQKLIRRKRVNDKNNPYKQFLRSCEKETNLFGALDKYLRDKYFRGKSFTRNELALLAEKIGSKDLLLLYHECEEAQYAGENITYDRNRIMEMVRDWEKKS